MNKIWIPITAGVLDIINGAFGIFMGLVFLTFDQLLGLYGTFYEIGGPLLIVIGVLAIVGGVYAFKRKRWRLALAGAIAAIIPSMTIMLAFWQYFDPGDFFSLPTLQGFIGIPAIVAIILTILSKKQFERK